MMRTYCLTLFTLLALLLGLASTLACKRQSTTVQEAMDSTKSLAVAPFTQAFSDSQLLSGYIPPGSQKALPSILTTLDSNLDASLEALNRKFIHVDHIRQYMPNVTESKGNDRKESALEYWITVGKCANTNYLLIPQIQYWHNREGGDIGVIQPAGVVISFYVIDVKEFSIVAYYHHDETQIALADNLLTLDKFIKRRGKWVTADILAQEGIARAIKVLNL